MINLNHLKTKVYALEYNEAFLWKGLYLALLKIYLPFKFITNSKFRSEKLTKTKYGTYLHQNSTLTKENRYPRLFQICKEYFKTNTKPNILSFGCSTGEEVSSIRSYLPNAQIYGVDINNYCLKKCQKKVSHNKNFFYHSQSNEFKTLNNLDAIFCLAVFQHPKNRNTPSQYSIHYKFSMFEDQLYDLNLKLKPGGLLFIDNCDFNFLETTLSKEYTVLDVANNQFKRLRPLFNNVNKKIANENNCYRVFKKNQ